MKKLNKNGFAISTLIYGLSILGLLLITMLMSTLSNTRSNAKEMSNAVEEDLNRYSRTSVAFSKSDKAQEFITPDGESGWYRIELWGAQGNNGSGGEGAYTTGIIELEEGDTLYFYVGKQGAAGEGGGETSVRVDNSNNNGSVASRIMVAGGGGTNASANGSTTSIYESTFTDNMKYNQYSKKITSTGNLTGMTYKNIKTINENPLTHNASNNSKEAGKGYYNGSSAAEGGSSFISGYAGSNAYSRGVASGIKYTDYNYSSDEGYTGNAIRDYYFYDGMMLEGIKTGDGLARIERVVRKTDSTQKLPRQNTKLNEVKKIKDCTDNNVASTTTIKAVKDGNLLNGHVESSDSKCVTYILDNATDVDEIAIWHGNYGVDYQNHIVTVYNTSNVASVIKGRSNVTAKSITETPTGIHISAYQPDYTQKTISSGDYYIFAVTSESKVLTTSLRSDQINNALKFENVVGGNNQKWSISPIDCKLYDNEATRQSCNMNNTGYPSTGTVEYKIEDLIRFYALNILLDENKVNNTIVANNTFNELTRNEPSIWKIDSLENGTIVISSSAQVFSSNIKAGGLTYFTNASRDYGEYANKLLIASKDSMDVSRFYLYRLNF